MLLVRGTLEDSLPKDLQERNQRIRSMWNDGVLQLNQSHGDSPAVLKKKMKDVERRLYIPTASGQSPTSTSPPDPAASLQQLKIAPSPSHGLTIAASPDPGRGLYSSLFR